MSNFCTHCGLIISKNPTKCNICNNDRNTVYHLDCIASHNVQFNHIKWHQERGNDWRKLEDKRLKMITRGHITTLIRNRRPTKKDERLHEFEHQLPRGNPNILPSLPEEYVK